MKKVCTEYYGYCLPIELIHEILTWLPGSALLRFKCVSKSWYRLISDPKFIKLNLAKSLKTNSNTSLMLKSFARLYEIPANQIYFNIGLSNRHHFFHPNNLVVTPLSHPNDGIIFKANKPVTSLVVGSCHGLVCIKYVFSLDIYNRFLIYNPTTRASKILPELEFSRSYTRILGFGYDCVSDDYKVLSTWNLGYSDDGSLWKSMYYSLKTDAWETVDNPPWDVTRIDFGSPVFVNNSFHWLPCEGKEIKCFSLSTRSYYEIPIPEKIHYRSEKLHTRIPSTNRLTEFKGQLCVVTSFFDIWMLKEYGNSESWTQVFRNTESLLIVTYYKGFLTLKPRVACFQGDHSNFILLLTRCCFGGQSLWLYCDVVSGTTKEIEMPSFLAEVELADSQPWVESLVPLHQSINQSKS